MSNKIYDGKMYNPEVKDRFLNQFSEITRIMYSQVFIQSALNEEMWERDLYNFSLDEIADTLFSLAPETISASRTRKSIVSNYIDWAIENGYRKSNISPFQLVSSDWHRKFARETYQLIYLSKKQIDKVVDETVNFQDKIIVQGIFEGISGEFFSELRNLKPSDINWDNGDLLLTNHKGVQRTLNKVSEKLITIIEGAIKEKEYLKKNGLAISRNRSATLINNGYVVKMAKMKSTKEQIDRSAIRARLRVLSEYFDIYELRKSNIIHKSGMLWMAKQLLESDGVLERQQFLKIAERFNQGYVEVNGYRSRNIQGLREFITVDNIQKLYGTQ